MVQDKKGYLPLTLALKEKAGGRSVAEFAAEFDVVPNTMYKVMSATIRPGVDLMQRILRKYPDLYDLVMEGYFGPRPENVVPMPRSSASTASVFGREFKVFQRNLTNAEYAVFLGVGYLTVYTIWKANPVPDIYILQRVVAKVPELYDLAAAVHFGKRPNIEMARAPQPATV